MPPPGRVPLAIELATRRLRAIPLEQLADRLEDRFRLLTGGRRAALPHHQTIRAATEWSYDLCSPAEQLLWARLTVFAGSFDTEAVEQVCAGAPLDREDILATLIGLVDKSVVLRTNGLGAGGEGTRYLLLETIREFGAEKLAAPGEQAAPSELQTLRDRHIGQLVISKRTVDAHIEHIYGKLGVSSRVQLASWLRTRPPE